MPDPSQADGPSWLDQLLGSVKDSVSTVTQFANTVTGVAKAGAASVQGNMQSGAAAYQAQSSAIGQESAAEQTVNTIKGQAAAKQHSDDAIAAQQLGVDNDGFAKKSAQISSSYDELLGYDKQLKEIAGHTLLNDPVNWVADLFRKPVIDDKRAAVVQELGDQNLALKNAQSATSAQFAVNASLDVATGANIIDAQNKAIAAKAAEASAVTGQEAAKYQNSALMAITSLTNAGFDAAVKANAVNANAADIAFKGMLVPAQVGFYSATEGERAEVTAQKLETQQERDLFTKDLQSASEVTGGAIPNTIAGYNNLKDANQRSAANNIIAANKVDRGTYGIDPIAAVNNAQGAGIVSATPGEEMTRRFIGGAIAKAEQINDSKGVNTKFRQLDPATRKELSLGQLNGEVTASLQDVSKPGSIYSTLSVAKAAALAPIASTDIGKAIAPLGADKNYAINGNDLISTAKDLISKNQLNVPQAAAQLKQIAQTLQMATNAAVMPQRYRLPVLGSDRAPGYNMSVQMPASVNPLGGKITKIVDFTNPAEVETFITRSLLQDQRIANQAGP